MAVALGLLGDIELAREDFKQAMIFYKEALSLDVKTGNKKNVTKHLIHLAKLFKKRGQIEHIAHILSVTENWLNLLPSTLRNDYDKMLEWLRTQVGEIAFGEMQSKGRAMTLEQLISLLEQM